MESPLIGEELLLQSSEVDSSDALINSEMDSEMDSTLQDLSSTENSLSDISDSVKNKSIPVNLKSSP